MEMAIIGLGKMGSALAKKALESGVRVYGLNLGGAPEEIIQYGLIEVQSIEELAQKMSECRKIFLYIPAGEAVEDYVKECGDFLEPGDVLIDGGNSYWGDSVRRAKYLAKREIHFVDMGTSGGISGARNGACFMAGGTKEAYELIEPLLEKIAGKDSYAYIGPSGSGHLVKLIHNGMEFGMLQAIGEGMALLERFKQDVDIDMEATFKVYRHGSVIRSWLMDLMAKEYLEHGGIKKISSHIEDTGEVNWLINDALHLEVPTPIIAQSVIELFRSRDNVKNDYRAVAMMRNGFGGHPFGKDQAIEKERSTSRIDEEFRLDDFH